MLQSLSSEQSFPILFFTVGVGLQRCSEHQQPVGGAVELYQFHVGSMPFALSPKCPKAVSLGSVVACWWVAMTQQMSSSGRATQRERQEWRGKKKNKNTDIFSWQNIFRDLVSFYNPMPVKYVITCSVVTHTTHTTYFMSPIHMLPWCDQGKDYTIPTKQDYSLFQGQALKKKRNTASVPSAAVPTEFWLLWLREM